ncbi:hypothetical protein CGZ80_08500 [Rhodopirellula sp. MGV]|nr:hypothetical protein CGZ80_08500 [Rhodopirellula sp. MGV]PNY38422.1 hypothetical protein C2E31_00280 [Rhodopirellula baltica]
MAWRFVKVDLIVMLGRSRVLSWLSLRRVENLIVEFGGEWPIEEPTRCALRLARQNGPVRHLPENRRCCPSGPSCFNHSIRP